MNHVWQQVCRTCHQTRCTCHLLDEERLCDIEALVIPLSEALRDVRKALCYEVPRCRVSMLASRGFERVVKDIDVLLVLAYKVVGQTKSTHYI
jgi:hypothetical protein